MRIFTLVWLVITLAACGSDDHSTPKATSWKTADTATFTVEYPADWQGTTRTADEFGTNTTAVFISRSEIEIPEDLYFVELYVGNRDEIPPILDRIQNEPFVFVFHMPVDQFVSVEDQIDRLTPGLEFVESPQDTPITISGIRGVRRVGLIDLTINSTSQRYGLYGIALDRNMLYDYRDTQVRDMIFMVAVVPEAQFVAVQPQFEHIAQSIRFK
jgi:hypothetical protein